MNPTWVFFAFPKYEPSGGWGDYKWKGSNIADLIKYIKTNEALYSEYNEEWNFQLVYLGYETEVYLLDKERLLSFVENLL